MLTYSTLLNSVTISPLQKIAAAQFAKSFFNSNFESDDFYEGDCSEILVSNFRELLANDFREDLEKAISDSNSFIETYKLPVGLKHVLKESIFSLYQAFGEFLFWKIRYACSDVKRFQKGEVQKQNYFTVDGEFNDSLCAKHLVLNSKLSTCDRFRLACLYCFGKEAATLWAEIKLSGDPPIEGDLNQFWNEEKLIRLWIYQLEGHFEAFKQEEQHEGNFWEVGLQVVSQVFSSVGFSHAVYYFWQKTDDSEKKSFIENFKFFELMKKYAVFPDDKINYILYSQLSEEQKEKLLDWTIANERTEIWCTLLGSPYTHTVCSEILYFVYKLPCNMKFCALLCLISRMKNFKPPRVIQTFKVLWCHLSFEQQSKLVLEEDMCIEVLIEAKLFHCLEPIIKCLSPLDKSRCLFDHLKVMDFLSKRGEFDLLQKYLSFFLFERDPTTGKESLRKDAGSFLQECVRSRCFEIWCRRLPGKVENEVKGQINSLASSLTLLDKLCDKVSGESEYSEISNKNKN